MLKYLSAVVVVGAFLWGNACAYAADLQGLVDKGAAYLEAGKPRTVPSAANRARGLRRSLPPHSSRMAAVPMTLS